MQTLALFALLGSLAPKAEIDAKPFQPNYLVAPWMRPERSAEPTKQERYEQWATRTLPIRFWPRVGPDQADIARQGMLDMSGHLGGFADMERHALDVAAEAEAADEHLLKELGRHPKLLPGTFRWLWRDLGRDAEKQKAANPFCFETRDFLRDDADAEAWKVADWLELNDPLFLRHELVPEVTDIGIGADFDMTPAVGSARSPIDRPIDLLRSPLLHGAFVGIRFRY